MRKGGITQIAGRIAASAYTRAQLPPFTRAAQSDLGTPMKTVIDAQYSSPGFANQAACEAYAPTVSGASSDQIAAGVAYCATLSWTPPVTGAIQKTSGGGWNSASWTNDSITGDFLLSVTLDDPSTIVFGMRMVTQPVGASVTTTDFDYLRYGFLRYHWGETHKNVNGGAWTGGQALNTAAGMVLTIQRTGTTIIWTYNGAQVHSVVGSASDAVFPFVMNNATGEIPVTAASMNGTAITWVNHLGGQSSYP